MHFRKTRTFQVKKANQRDSRPEEENGETDFHFKAYAGPVNLSCILKVSQSLLIHSSADGHLGCFQSLEPRWGKAKSRVCLK